MRADAFRPAVRERQTGHSVRNELKNASCVCAGASFPLCVHPSLETGF